MSHLKCAKIYGQTTNLQNHKIKIKAQNRLLLEHLLNNANIFQILKLTKELKNSALSSRLSCV